MKKIMSLMLGLSLLSGMAVFASPNGAKGKKTGTSAKSTKMKSTKAKGTKGST